MHRFPCPILKFAHSFVNYVQLVKEFQTHYIEMPSEQCLRVLVRILRILEQFDRPDAHIWQEVLECLNEVISLLEADLNVEESSSEEEQEMDR